MTVVEVPRDCVGYVTGRAGAVLRKIEEEWGTLMFFAEKKDPRAHPQDAHERGGTERLIIFGNESGQRRQACGKG